MNTEQFWQGQFGDDYTERNINLVENNYQMFRGMFLIDYLIYDDINSIIEFGAGSGQNIQALQRIFPDAKFSGLEINNKAAYKLMTEVLKEGDIIITKSILEYENDENMIYNLVLTKGLLIHIHPDDIEKAYDVLYNASNKYILICEYYSPDRIMIPYRGENDKLWKFDFVKPLLDKGCKILDYGFVSKYNKYPQDDLTWFLMEKERYNAFKK